MKSKKNYVYSLYINCENQYGRARYFQLAMCGVAVTVRLYNSGRMNITRTDVYVVNVVITFFSSKIKRIKNCNRFMILYYEMHRTEKPV